MSATVSARTPRARALSPPSSVDSVQLMRFLCIGCRLSEVRQRAGRARCRMGSPEIEPAEAITILPTLAFARAGDTLLLCYVRPQGPSDSDWAVWLDRLRIPDF